VIVNYHSHVLELLGKLRRTKIYYYPRPVTTGAVATVAVLTTLIARGLLPRSARPPGALWVVAASFFAYGILRLDNHMHYSKRFKHTYMDRFGGDVDDAQTWILAGLSGGAALAFGQVLRRLIRVSGSTENPKDSGFAASPGVPQRSKEKSIP
jgi:hypothetical protein